MIDFRLCAYPVALAVLALTVGNLRAQDTNVAAKSLERVKVPEVDFREANIRDVVRFIKDKSSQSDDGEKGEQNKGVNLILRPDVAKDGEDTGNTPRITFQARNISLLETLKIVTELANLKYRIQGNVVMIVPKDAPDGEVIHKMYDVQSSFGQSIDKYKDELRGGAPSGK